MSAEMKTTKKKLSIHADKHRLNAELIQPRGGKSRKPSLVFLHEGLGSIGQWRDFPERMCAATGCTVLVYERWGHGDSDPLTGPRKPNYLHEEALISLPEVLAQCGIKKPVLIGHSDGGSIALLFAGAYPQNVLGVVTEAAHVFVEAINLAGIRRAAEAFRHTDVKKRLARYHGDNTESMFQGWADTWLSPGFRDWNIMECLPRIVCPLLAIQGIEDEYGTPAQVEAIVNKVSGRAKGLMIYDCGHIPHIQAKEKVFSETINFISELIREKNPHGVLEKPTGAKRCRTR